jgi:hypothetical protein
MEIVERLRRKALEELAAVAKPDTLLADTCCMTAIRSSLRHFVN